jgi:hypothetical protein
MRKPQKNYITKSHYNKGDLNDNNDPHIYIFKNDLRRILYILNSKF